MAEITGRFISDLHPNGTVRMVFIASQGICSVTVASITRYCRE